MTVKSLTKSQSGILAVNGLATNTSQQSLVSVMLSFPLYFEGLKVCDAIASTQGLEPGRSWAFEALIISGVTKKPFDEVGKPKVTAFAGD